MQGGKKSEVRIQKAEGRNTRETRNSRERGNSCGVLRFRGKHKNISAATFGMYVRLLGSRRRSLL
jgi:hypothetical protein